MRGDLVRKLAARGLATGGAVLAFLVVAFTGATGWGLGLAVAALAAIVWERRVRPGADNVAETTLVAAGVLVGYARQLGPGFDPALAAAALVLLGLLLLTGPLRDAGNLEIRAANLPVRTWVPQVAARLGDAVAGLLAVLALAALAALPAAVAAGGEPAGGRRRRRGRARPGPAAVPAGRRRIAGHPGAAPAPARVRAALLRPARLGIPGHHVAAVPGTDRPAVRGDGARAGVAGHHRGGHHRPGALLPHPAEHGRGAGAQPAGGVLRQPRREERPLSPLHPAHPRAAASRRQRQGVQRQPGVGDLRPDLRGRRGGHRPVRPGRGGDPGGEVRRGRPPAGRDDRGTRRTGPWPGQPDGALHPHLDRAPRRRRLLLAADGRDAAAAGCWTGAPR